MPAESLMLLCVRTSADTYMTKFMTIYRWAVSCFIDMFFGKLELFNKSNKANCITYPKLAWWCLNINQQHCHRYYIYRTCVMMGICQMSEIYSMTRDDDLLGPHMKVRCPQSTLTIHTLQEAQELFLFGRNEKHCMMYIFGRELVVSLSYGCLWSLIIWCNMRNFVSYGSWILYLFQLSNDVLGLNQGGPSETNIFMSNLLMLTDVAAEPPWLIWHIYVKCCENHEKHLMLLSRHH